MKPEDFILRDHDRLAEEGEHSAQAPSNIALVKYWGKVPEQMPCNPSISLTLKKALTETHLSYRKNSEMDEDLDVQVYLDGERQRSFEPKVIDFFQRIQEYVGFVKDHKFVIRTSNTFPHSSGIASSASAMASIAVCLMEMEKSMEPKMTRDHYYKKASFLARLGSGSACRSIIGKVVLWGQLEDKRDSSDLYGIRAGKVHHMFSDYQDAILLVDKGKKSISSSQGHRLMHAHPYAKTRFREAGKNASQLLKILKNGNLADFIALVEKEALSLHAMMMTSDPYFILMQPNTLDIIKRIWTFRNDTGVPVCFTLDAGANVHLLYPKRNSEKVMRFIEEDLKFLCQEEHVIYDEVGNGAKVLK